MEPPPGMWWGEGARCRVRVRRIFRKSRGSRDVCRVPSSKESLYAARGGGRPGDEWREGLDLVMRRHVRTGFVAVTSREGDPLKKTGSGLSWSNFGGRTSRGINFSNPHS